MTSRMASTKDGRFVLDDGEEGEACYGGSTEHPGELRPAAASPGRLWPAAATLGWPGLLLAYLWLARCRFRWTERGCKGLDVASV